MMPDAGYGYPHPGSVAYPADNGDRPTDNELTMIIIFWLILAVISLPLALLALVLYPLAWLLLLPFRIVGIAVDGVLETVKAVVTLPARLLGRR